MVLTHFLSLTILLLYDVKYPIQKYLGIFLFFFFDQQFIHFFAFNIP